MLKDIVIDIVVAFAVFLMVGSAVRRPISEGLCEPEATPARHAAAAHPLIQKTPNK